MYKNIFLNNLDKFKLIYNKKDPACKWCNKDNYFKILDFKKCNVGIPCGEKNNLIVLDIDFKDEGIEEFNKYIELFEKPDTLIIQSPNNGFHYYFTYQHSSESTKYLIDNSLKNSTKYRGKGIDIRTNGGYIVAPDSSIDNKKYKIINDVIPIEIPETLVLWLLENKNIDEKDIDEQKNITKNNKKNEKYNTTNLTNNYSYIYDITDNKLKDILNKLDNSWYDDYNKWLIILTILKSLNKFEIFDIFSKKSKKYNSNENLKMWNCNTGCIDINYLILRINTEQKINLPFVEKYKILPSSYVPSNIKQIKFNKQFLDIDNEIFNNYDTLIIKSDTGTGKTTYTSKQIKKYLKIDGNKYQFISIVNLINLCKQQIFTFNKNKFDIKSYKTGNVDYFEDNFVICINSLKKLDLMDDDYFANKIIYIDEINSFLESLTHNKTLDNYIKIIYEILIKLLKKAHKIIVTDATILNNVFDFLKFRDIDKTIFITNEYQKYKGINAIQVKDENLFIEKINNDIKNNKYFLFACDSCEIITKFYLKFTKNFVEKAKDMILITSESKFEINNASKDFKNKWVFYSPSIITGVDFSIKIKQNQYVYVKGDTISPSSIYQQSTRNRNINTLYYYINNKSENNKYNSLEEVKQNYKKLISINHKLNNVCKQFNEKEESYINENMFFDLFCYNEYILDIYNTNKKIHYENILKNKGFILGFEGTELKINTKTKNEMSTLYKNVDIIEEYLNDKNLNKSKDEKYQNLIDDINLFNLKTNEEIIKYKDILSNKFKIQHFFNYIKLLNYNGENMKDNINCYDIKKITTNNEKIKIIHKLYKEHNIEYLSLDNFDKIKEIKLTDDEYYYIKKLFRTEKEKPINNVEMKYFIIGCLKNLIGNLDIIETKQTKDSNNMSVYNYTYSNKIELMNDLYSNIEQK
jgi:hypothetical protein